jgi:uncharacterized protein with ACT and thioredoxin-like domain
MSEAIGKMKLFCFVVGEKGDAFSIKIETTESVDDLKKEIVVQQRYDIAASKLKLFLAITSDNRWLEIESDDANKLENGEKTELVEELTQANRRLNGAFGLHDVFTGKPEPELRQIHILVVVPEDAEEGFPRKRLRTEVSVLTTQLQSFVNAELHEECIQSKDQSFLPYPHVDLKILYVRQCYRDVYNLILEDIKEGRKLFAISGTPGIGKSLFFVYMLYRLLNDTSTENMITKPKYIVYDCARYMTCIDLENKTEVDLDLNDAKKLIDKQDTLYVIDGKTTPLPSHCTTLFISSPRDGDYKQFVEHKNAIERYFPVWTLTELQTCQSHCYPELDMGELQQRYRIYGGVARFIFDKKDTIKVLQKMEASLNDADAVRGVQYKGTTTDIFPASHKLMHIIVGTKNNETYQYIDLDVASEYVGRELWIRNSAQMLENMQIMFTGSPNEISRHLFEIYGHMVFSVGGKDLRCRCLENDTTAITEIKLSTLNGNRTTFGIDTIPIADELSNNYYEASDSENFPAIDSLSSQGMFQFTVARSHSIRGVTVLIKLCKLYQNPKLYFVVPKHRFKAFTKQKFLSTKGTEAVKEISNLKQYVIELPVGILKSS